MTLLQTLFNKKNTKKIKAHALKAVLATLFVHGNASYAQTAQPVSKSTSNKIYVHLMPWFEAKDYSGYWGIHWTMANQNPDIMDNSGKRQIAAHYYPLIGPYSSADPDVVEYQLLLMKLSGIDGVLIDWPGTANAMDYPRNRANAEAFINKVDDVGLEFAVVYEDHNLELGSISDKLGQAQNDMRYLNNNYFQRNEYSKINGQPLMLVFGPQTLQNAGDWSSVFSVIPNKPHFLTLWYEHQEAGANSSGEYAWIYQDNNAYYDHLANFYNYATNYGTKMGAVSPGFNAFYEAGGWQTNPFYIDSRGTGLFESTLDLALANNIQHIQIATWNDYGEGTMIEPSREYGYGFLTALQNRLGVNYGQAELELVQELYNQRKTYKGNTEQQARLDQAARYLSALQIGNARNTLNNTTPPNNGGTEPQWSQRIEAENFTVSAAIGVENCSEGGQNIGWLDAGDWVVWDINLPSSGQYKVEYRTAGVYDGIIQLEKAGGAPVYGQINVPATGGWQNWQTISHTVNLDAGQQHIAIYVPVTGYNINWIQFTKM